LAGAAIWRFPLKGEEPAGGNVQREAGVVRPEVTHDGLERAASELIGAAAERGLVFRAIGGIGVRHCLRRTKAAYDRQRPVPGDIDLLTSPAPAEPIRRVFVSLGYVPDERVIAWHGKKRHVYFHLGSPNSGPDFRVDVFIGVPPLCHRVDLTRSLETPDMSLAPTDLLLLKLQIVRFTEKDLVDTGFLLWEHATERSKLIDFDRVSRHLRDDWGFYFTASQNLDRLLQSVREGLWEEGASSAILATAEELRRAIEAAPKTLRWKLRARVGSKIRWYEEVEEIER
jgi:hypothetical protein